MAFIFGALALLLILAGLEIKRRLNGWTDRGER
jgi:hypothetical protein